MKQFTILATSDLHGYITPFRYSDQKEDDFGIAKISTLIKNNRDENTILIDNGDTLQGSPFLYYHYLNHKDEVHPMSIIFNEMKYDYLSTGNHDFNFGYSYMKNFYQHCNAPCITGNIVEEGKPFRNPYTIHTFQNGVRIALIGVVTQHIPNWEQPQNITGYTFIDAFQFVKDTVDLIHKKEKLDAIVVSYHGGFEKDLVTGEPTEVLNGENLGYKMCTEIDGIDVLITGHQHRSIATHIGKTAVTQTAINGGELAKITFTFENGKWLSKPNVIVPKCEADMKICKLIEKEENEVQEWLDQPMGELESGDLLIHDPFDARVHKHRIVSFFNQVQNHVANTTIAGNALANVVKGFNKSITMRDIVSTYVYPNTLVVMGVTGKQFKEILEICAEYFSIENGQLIVTPRFESPKPQHYNYDMYDGVEYTLDIRKPIGQRVVSMRKDNKDIKEDDYLEVVVNNYRSTGGGDFAVFKECKVVRPIMMDMVECIAVYIQKYKTIKIDHKDNIHILY